MPFIAPLIPMAIGAAGSIAAGAAAAAPIISAGAGIAGIVGTAYGMSQKNKMPNGIQNLTPPNLQKIASDEKENILRVRQKRTKSILTSPLGVAGPADQNTARKTLLGPNG